MLKQVLLFLAILLLRASLRRRMMARKKRLWCRPWISMRNKYGAYCSLVKELQNDDSKGFHNFLRMDLPTFEMLLDLIRPRITKRNTRMRPAIPAAERLAVTLRYLATGDTFASLQYLYRIPKNTISGIVHEVCVAIYQFLSDKYMRMPKTSDEWKEIASGFEQRWNLPHCIGSIDGKHIQIRAPANSGSTYFNYKHWFSTVLLALVDHDYNFLAVDVGVNGRISDSGVLDRSNLGKALKCNALKLPPPSPILGCQSEVPYYIVADAGFALTHNVMRPYALRQISAEERIFNYRLSRARRVVENAFGILASRFRVFQRPMALEPRKVDAIVLAACTLHNFLRTHSRSHYSPSGTTDSEDQDTGVIIPGRWRTAVPMAMQSVSRQGTSSCSVSAKAARDMLCCYLNGVGSVPWQKRVLEKMN